MSFCVGHRFVYCVFRHQQFYTHLYGLSFQFCAQHFSLHQFLVSLLALSEKEGIFYCLVPFRCTSFYYYCIAVYFYSFLNLDPFTTIRLDQQFPAFFLCLAEFFPSQLAILCMSSILRAASKYETLFLSANGHPKQRQNFYWLCCGFRNHMLLCSEERNVVGVVKREKVLSVCIRQSHHSIYSTSQVSLLFAFPCLGQSAAALYLS